MNGSTIKVEMIKEHEDGSADFIFDLTPEMMQALLRFGIIKALEAGIEEARKNYTPDEPIGDFKAGGTD